MATGRLVKLVNLFRTKALRAELERVLLEKKLNDPSDWRASVEPLPAHEMTAEEAARYEARTGDLRPDEWDS
jgi:hypothetical protein